MKKSYLRIYDFLITFQSKNHNSTSTLAHELILVPLDSSWKMAHKTCIDHDLILKWQWLMTISIFENSWNFQYFNCKKYFFYGGIIKFYFYFVYLVSSYTMIPWSIRMEWTPKSYDFFSENNLKKCLFKNYRKKFFFFKICQFFMCLLLFSIARNSLARFLNHKHM